MGIFNEGRVEDKRLYELKQRLYLKQCTTCGLLRVHRVIDREGKSFLLQCQDCGTICTKAHTYGFLKRRILKTKFKETNNND